MKHFNKFKTRTFCLMMFVTLTSFSLHAQYTLVDGDVEMENGYIKSLTTQGNNNIQDKSIIIPSTLQSQSVIGIVDGNGKNGVFSKKSITGVKLPGTMKIIGINAFRDSKINTVDFSDCKSLQIIGNTAFFCNSISSIDFSNCVALEEIKDLAFSAIKHCGEGHPAKHGPLTDLDLSDCKALKLIGSKAFFAQSLGNVNLNGCTSLEVIGSYAFAFNKLTSVDLSNCKELYSINLGVFLWNTIATVTLPVPQTQEFVGWNHDSSNITYNGELPTTVLNSSFSILINHTLEAGDITIDADGIIQSCSYHPGNYKVHLSIPEQINGITVKGIADKTKDDGVFGNKKIRKVDLPGSIEKIGDYAFYANKIGDLDLSNYTSLQTIGINSFSANRLKSVSFENCMALEKIGLESFGSNKLLDINFSGCKSLKIIGESSFNFSELNSLDLSACTALEVIGKHAFYHNKIKTLDISGCSLLHTINSSFVGNSIGNTKLPNTGYPNLWYWYDERGNNYQPEGIISFNNAEHFSARFYYILKDSDVEVDDNGKIIQCNISDFNKEEYYNGTIGIPETLHGKKVRGILSSSNNIGVFSDKGINDLILPNTLEEIGESAFSNNSISTVDFNKCISLKRIGKGAFYNNTITSVNLSTCKKLQFIGKQAFDFNDLTFVDLTGCESLHTIEGQVFKIDSKKEVTFDFSNCSKLHTIKKAAFYSLYGDIKFKLVKPEYNGFINWACTDGNTYEGSTELNFTKYQEGIKAQIKYTLQEGDVEIDEKGFIQSCNYDGNGTYITIPEVINNQKIKGIADTDGYLGVFSNNDFTTVILPSSIEYIGKNAFNSGNRFGLLDVDFSNCQSLKTIRENAFLDNNLRSIDLSNCISLETIEEYGFRDNLIATADLTKCEKLRFIGINAFLVSNNSLPKILTELSLPVSAYWGFKGWQDSDNSAVDYQITISDGHKAYNVIAPYELKSGDVSIDDNGFITHCNISNFNTPEYENGSIFIPEFIDGISIKGIACTDKLPGVFSQKGINKIALVSTIKQVGDFAFYGNNISEFVVENESELAYIGKNSFAKNKLSHINISNINTLRNIGENAFTDNSTELMILPTPVNCPFLNWIDHEGGTFSGNAVVKNLATSYKAQIPYILQQADVTIDDNGIITQCSYDHKTIFYIIIPESIGDKTIKGIGNSVFFAKGLTTIELPSTIEVMKSKSFINNDLRNLDLSHLSKLRVIEWQALHGNLFEEIELPKPDIENFLNWVDGEGQTYKDNHKVNNFSSFIKAQITYTLQDSDIEIDQNGMILSCSYNGPGTYIIIPETLKGITVKGIIDAKSYSEGAFNTKDFTYVNLPATIEHIGDFAFDYNKDLLGVNFNECPLLNNIGKRAFFYNCLLTLDLSNCKQLTNIGDDAFARNNIASINFGQESSLETIGKMALDGNMISILDLNSCTSLKRIGYSAFDRNKLQSFTLPTNKSFGFKNWKASHPRTGNNLFINGNDVTDKIDYSFEAQFNDLYNITYHNVGTRNVIANPKVYTIDHTINLASPKDSIGYSFEGWFTDKDLTNGILEPAIPQGSTGDVDFYAKWTIKQFSVSFIDWDGAELNKQLVDYGNAALAPADPERLGYNFVGWDIEFNNITDNLTITAQYNPIATVLDNEKVDDLEVFPNPVINTLNIKTIDYIQCKIYNATGKIVKHFNLNKGITSVDIEDLEKGIYILQLIGNNNTKITRSIMKR